MRTSIILFCLLIASNVEAGGLPDWNDAQKVIESCYGGWDGVITVSAGLRGDYSMNDYHDSTVTKIVGEQSSTGGYSSYDGSETTASEEAEYDLSESVKEMDATYSRDRATGSAFAGIALTVPLYSREKRIKRREHTDSRIEHMADLYAKYEGHRATAAALDKEVVVMRRVLEDEGYQGINNYYQILAEREKSVALMNSAARKINMILRRCGYVEGNRPDRKRQSSKKAVVAKAEK